MRSEEGLSLRGVASEMGMTPPALYRYVDSYRDLQLIVARAVTADLVTALREAIEPYPQDDPAARVMMAAVAFRTWALENPAEFGMVFANPELTQYEATEQGPAGGALGAVFSDLYQQLHERFRFDVRLPTDFTLAPPGPGSAMPTMGNEGLAWLMLRHWVRLYGIVTLEVFKQVPADVIDSGALFLAAIGDNAVELGLREELPRLHDLMRAKLSRGPYTLPTPPG